MVKGKGSLIANVIVILLLSITSCARLPDFAKPHFNLQVTEESNDFGAFGYRILTKADFKASSLPEDYIQYSNRINARSCLGLRSSKQTHMQISTSSYSGINFYVGSIEEVAYEAVFRPSCSWWNPNLSQKRKPYVLEHEQIHFALLELAARELSRTSMQELASFIALGDSVDEVKEQLVKKVHILGQKVIQVNLEDQTRFDEETSLYYDPAAQKRWYAEVMRRLEEENSSDHP